MPLLNGKFCKGQYTYKIYHLASKFPGWIKMIAPSGSLEIHEEAWNAYPYYKTVISNPGYMQEKFYIVIESYHIGDKGQSENVHELDKEKLEERTVVPIDVANDPVNGADFKRDEDPANFVSKKTGRGPLKERRLDCHSRPSDDLLQARQLPVQVGGDPEQGGEIHPIHREKVVHKLSQTNILLDG